jgi:hypothetical protein
MSTITATADSAKSQVRLDLDFSDIDAPYVLVNRVDPVTGAATQVRGHGSSTSIGGVAYAPMQAGYKAVLYDTEAPLDSAVYYTATAPLATLNANPTFADGYVDPWYDTSGGLFVAVRATSSRSGTTFLSFQTDGTVANPHVYGEDIAATPGASFTIAATMSANVSQSVLAGLNFRNAAGAIISSPSTTATVLTSTVVTLTAVAPANTVSVQPYMAMNGTPAATTIVSASQVIVTSAAGSATSGGVLLPSLGASQLKDPLQPGNNVRVDFSFDPDPLCIPAEGVFWQSLDVEQQAANAATFNINNQPEPVVVSKVRSSVTSTLTLVSRTFADRDRLVALLAPGSPLLFQAPDEYGMPDRYLSVGATSITRILPDHRIPIRVFSLPHVVVASPGGPMGGTVGARWSDTCNVYATWAAVNAAGLTWTQVLQGLAG